MNAPEIRRAFRELNIEISNVETFSGVSLFSDERTESTVAVGYISLAEAGSEITSPQYR